MTTSEAIGCFRVFEMSPEDGAMTARTEPRMTAAECFEFIDGVKRMETGGVFEQAAPLGVYRRVEGGWEEVLR